MPGCGPTVNLLLFVTQIIHNSSICIVHVCVFNWFFLKVDYVSTLTRDRLQKDEMKSWHKMKEAPRLIEIFLKILYTRFQPHSH